MADTVIEYHRGSLHLKNVTGVQKVNAKVNHGLVGKLHVGGRVFDTLERMDGYVCMAGDRDYPNSSLYWMDKYGSYVINPDLGKDAEQSPQKRNILFHPASLPSHLEGCVGVGLLSGNTLTRSKECFDFIWNHCGGVPGAKAKTVLLRVVGTMKPLKDTAELSGVNPAPDLPLIPRGWMAA